MVDYSIVASIYTGGFRLVEPMPLFLSRLGSSRFAILIASLLCCRVRLDARCNIGPWNVLSTNEEAAEPRDRSAAKEVDNSATATEKRSDPSPLRDLPRGRGHALVLL